MTLGTIISLCQQHTEVWKSSTACFCWLLWPLHFQACMLAGFSWALEDAEVSLWEQSGSSGRPCTGLQPRIALIFSIQSSTIERGGATISMRWSFDRISPRERWKHLFTNTEKQACISGSFCNFWQCAWPAWWWRCSWVQTPRLTRLLLGSASAKRTRRTVSAAKQTAVRTSSLGHTRP